MNRLIILLLSLGCIIASAASPSWHEDMVSYMNRSKDVDRSVVLDRNPNTGNIRNASYRYSFKNKNLYRMLRSKLINAETEATNVVMNPGNDGEIMMRFVNGDETRNYSLSKVDGRYQLVIAVKEGTSGNRITVTSASSSAEIRRQTEEARKQAVEARKQAAEARKQAAEARRQAAEARRQAINSGHVIINNSIQDNSAELKAHRDKLKAAAQERKRILDGKN